MDNTNGQSNILGIGAQLSAALSVFLEHLSYEDFEAIELEDSRFKDFNLVFSNGKRRIVEVKSRKQGFGISDLRKVYEDLKKNRRVNEDDEVLIIAKNVSKEFKEIVKNYSKYPDLYYEKLKNKKHLDKEDLKLLNQTKYWNVTFEANKAEDVTRAIFSKYIDYGLHKGDIDKLFKSLWATFFEYSSKGERYLKSDFFEFIKKEKDIVKEKDGFRYDPEKNKLDSLIDKLKEELRKVKRGEFSDLQTVNSVSSIASSSRSLMLYTLKKIEDLSEEQCINLEIIGPILNLNVDYQYSFSISKILKNSTSRENIKFIIEYLKKESKTLYFAKIGGFWILDFVDIAKKIIEVEPKFSRELVDLIKEVFENSNTQYLYFKKRKDSYEDENLIELLNIIFDSTEEQLIKDRVFEIIKENFVIVEKDYENYIHNRSTLYNLILKHISTSGESKIEEVKKLIQFLVEDYEREYLRYGEKYKFNGYEHTGSFSTWHGDEFTLEDRDFIDNLIIPLLKQYESIDAKSFWKYLEEIISKPVSASNPDFLKRSAIPFLLNKYFKSNGKEKNELEKYLTRYIKDKKGIPSKSELIFQSIYRGDYDDNDVWRLIEISLETFELGQNWFVEKVVDRLMDSSNLEIANKARNQILKWLTNKDFIQRGLTWHETLHQLLNHMLDIDMEKAIDGISSLINNGYFNKIDNFEIYSYTKVVNKLLKLDFTEGLKIIDLLGKKESLSTNEQLLYTASFYSITDRDEVSSDYLINVYEKFITPFLNKYNSIDKIVKRLTHANARDPFVDIAEAIVQKKEIKDRIGKSLRVFEIFIEDPDPYLPGNDPEDPKGQHSGHNDILKGESDTSIYSIRGKIAYAIRLFIIGESRDYMDTVISLIEKLIDDKNYYVLNMVGGTIERLGQSRLWLMSEGSDELFLSSNVDKALKKAKHIEQLAFRYLEKISKLPEGAKKGLSVMAAHAFNNIRALNLEDTKKFFRLIEKFPNESMHNFAPYFVYYSFYRKQQYRNWKFKSKGLYDDLEPGLFDEDLFYQKLLKGLNVYGQHFQLEVLHMIDTLIKQKPNDIDRIKKVFENILKDFEVGKYNSIFMMVQNLIEENFEFAYFMYIEALKVQKKELGKLSDEELISLRQLNYHYDIDLILQEIFNNKGEKEFLKTIKRIYSLPIPVYIYKFKDVEETLLNLSNTTLTKEVFDVLRGNGMSGDINPYYQELYEKWKTKQKN